MKAISLNSASRMINLDHTLSCGQVFRWKKHDESWFGMIGDILVKMTQRGGNLKINSSIPISESEIIRYLRLDDNLHSIMNELCRDKIMSRVIADVSGVRILRQDPWECLVSYICSRNCRIPMIRRVLDNLCHKFGMMIMLNGYIDYSFPTPDTVYSAKLSELINCRFRYGRKQAHELGKIAEYVCNGSIDFDVLRRLSYREAKKVLMSFDHGIGNKVADCVLLFSLDKLEAFPVDVWIARAMTQLYKKHFRSDLIRRIRRDRRVSLKDYEVLSDFGRQYFGQYAGYAQEYLYYWVRQRQGVCDLD